MEIFLQIIILLLGLFAYLMPAYVAKRCDNRNTRAIFALNILTGWTGIGWVVSMVWALYR